MNEINELYMNSYYLLDIILLIEVKVILLFDEVIDGVEIVVIVILINVMWIVCK